MDPLRLGFPIDGAYAVVAGNRYSMDCGAFALIHSWDIPREADYWKIMVEGSCWGFCRAHKGPSHHIVFADECTAGQPRISSPCS